MAFSTFTALLVLAASVRGLAIERDDTALPAAPFVVNLTHKTARSEHKKAALRELRHGRPCEANVTATLGGSDGAQEYLTDITVGGQSFKVIVDTGSSDTWLVKQGFQCFNLTSHPENQTECGFGSDGFDPSKSKTWTPIPDKNFNISYGDGEFLTGAMGYDTVTVGGLTVKSQEVGLVDKAAWNGDGVNSGLMGLAFPDITSAFNGTDPDKDSRNNSAPYNPFFFTAIQENAVQNPYFSIALNRGTLKQEQNESSWIPNLGYLAFGGIAPVPVTSNAVTVPVQQQKTKSEGNIYTYYTVDIDAYVFPGSKKVNTTGQAILDTGTTLNLVPTKVAKAYNARFKPKARFDKKQNLYFVDCKAKAPPFSVTIGGKSFPVDPRDQILSSGTDKKGKQLCISGTQDGGTPTADNVFIMGDVFLHNVVSTFQVASSNTTGDGNKVTLTQRQPY